VLSSIVPLANLVVESVIDTEATVSWTIRSGNKWGAIHQFEVEISWGPYSEDFTYVGTVDASDRNSVADRPLSPFLTIPGRFTATNLEPETVYRIRVIPVFMHGRGRASMPVTFQTLPPVLGNYWERATSRRLSMQGYGGGYSNPVLSAPHLDTGVEIFGERTSDNPLRFSDPATSESPAVPSPRRGHTVNTIGNKVYLFGGHTDGE
jgi:hypothetical protein